MPRLLPIMQGYPQPQPEAAVEFANPTALVGPTATNGAAATAMRSDAAPAINLTANYDWTGAHTFTQSSGKVWLSWESADTGAAWNIQNTGTGGKRWAWWALGNAETVGAAGSLVLMQIDTVTKALEVDINRNVFIARTLHIGNVVNAAVGEARAALGFSARIDGSGGGFFAGAASDVQWLRGEVNRWDTPDSVKIDVNLIVGNPSVTVAGISIGKTDPTILIDETDAAANNRIWETLVSGEQLRFRVVNDAYTVAGNWCVVDRTGTTIDLVTFPGTAVKIDGNVGIGVAPSTILHIKGASPTIRVTGTATNQDVLMRFFDNDVSNKGYISYSGANPAGNQYFGIIDSASDYLGLWELQNKDIRFHTNSVERGRMDGSGNFVWGTAALATTATNGFIYLPTCAGTPTGTPTAYTGRVAMVFDTTNNKLWIYDGGWIGVVLA